MISCYIRVVQLWFNGCCESNGSPKPRNKVGYWNVNIKIYYMC